MCERDLRMRDSGAPVTSTSLMRSPSRDSGRVACDTARRILGCANSLGGAVAATVASHACVRASRDCDGDGRGAAAASRRLAADTAP